MATPGGPTESRSNNPEAGYYASIYQTSLGRPHSSTVDGSDNQRRAHSYYTSQNYQTYTSQRQFYNNSSGTPEITEDVAQRTLDTMPANDSLNTNLRERGLTRRGSENTCGLGEVLCGICCFFAIGWFASHLNLPRGPY